MSDAGSEGLIASFVDEKYLCFFVVEDLVEEYLQVPFFIDHHVGVSDTILQRDIIFAIADHIEEPLILVLVFVTIQNVEPEGNIVWRVLAFVKDSFLRDISPVSSSNGFYQTVTKHKVCNTFTDVRSGHHDLDIISNWLMKSKALAILYIFIVHFIHLSVLTV